MVNRGLIVVTTYNQAASGSTQWMIAGIEEIYPGIFEADITLRAAGVQAISERVIKLLRRQAKTRKDREEIEQLIEALGSNGQTR